MKVLIATPYYYPQTGGLENYARHLADGLKQVGHEVVVVCGDKTVTRPSAAQLDGYTVHRLPIWKVVSNTPIHGAWPGWVKRIIRAEQPDVINVHAPVVYMVDVVVRSAGHIPTVITWHAATLSKPASPVITAITSAYGFVQAQTFKKARRIIAVSPYVKACLPAKLQAKTTVVPNAVPAVAPGRTKPGTGYVFIANLEPTHAWKGLGEIIEAWHVLKQTGRPVPPLRVIGDGASRQQYEALVAAYHLENSVTFYGLLRGTDRDAVASQAAGLLLYPTTPNDAFPTVLLEAWSLGLGVIGSAIGPIPSLVESGVTGLVVPAADPAELANTIAGTTPAQLQTMGEAGRQLTAREYTWDTQVKRTLAVFTELLK